MCVYVFVYLDMCMQMQLEARGQHQMSFSVVLLLILRQGLSLTLGLTDLPTMVVQQAPGSFLLPPPHLQDGQHAVAVLPRCRDPNSGPHLCAETYWSISKDLCPFSIPDAIVLLCFSLTHPDSLYGLG